MANIYTAPALSTMKVSTFKGSDCSVPEDQQKAYRAARSENMMPYAVGEVGKRPGVQKADYFGENGYPFTSGYNLVGAYKNAWIFRDATEDEPYYSITLRVKRKDKGDYVWVAVLNEAAIDIMPKVFECGDTTCIFTNSTKDIISGFFGDIKNVRNVVLKLQGSRLDLFTYTKNTTAERNPLHVGVEYIANYGWQPAYTGYEEWAGTIPHVIQGANPDTPSGSPYQAVNMFNPYVTESFCIKEGVACVFYLNTQGITATELKLQGIDADNSNGYARYSGNLMNGYFKVQVLCVIKDENDETSGRAIWVDRQLTEDDGYNPAENRLYLSPEGNKAVELDALGALGADDMIAASPVEGEDNVRITFWRSGAYEDFMQLVSAEIGAGYGVGGHKDRLFLGGGTFGGRIYYSEMEDPLYIADINYINLSDSTEIMAMDGTTDALTIMTDNGIYLATASAIDTTDNAGYIRDAIVTISNRIPAPPPKNGGKTAILGGEVVYLSTEGVIAVAAKENYAARYAEHRSAMIDREMLKDDPQELISLGRFLMIRCADGVWWLLDENQPNSEGDKPYASHQYEGWRLTGMPCDAAFSDGGVLYLEKDGYHYRWTDGTQASHFHDEYHNGNAYISTAIAAWWEIPWIYGNTVYKNKIFQRLGLLLGQLNGADTGVKVEGKKNDETEWTLLWNYDGSLCTFGYDKIDYSLFTYAGTAGNPNRSRKIKIKKAKQFKLRFSNDYFNQPLILLEYGLDYVQES